MTRGLIKYVLIAIVGLGLAMVSAPAFSADVTGKISTQTAPVQSNTQTAPVKTNTRTAPLPSTTREYQQVDKPPVQRLDIPDYDLAGDLRIQRVDTSRKNQTSIHFQLALMNKGKQNYINDGVQIKVRLINVLNQTQFKCIQYPWSGPAIVNDYWKVEDVPRYIMFDQTKDRGAPRTINDVKMIVDIDPRNTFGEEQRHRGNNRCVVTW